MSGASIEETLELWAASLREVKARMRSPFTQERVAASAGLFLDGLLGEERRKTGWMRAEAAGDPGPWRQQAFGGAHHQPEREQPFPPRSPHRLGDQTDEALLGRRGGANHATSRSTAVATSPGVISVRQRWWPSGHVAVPVEEHGRQSSPRSSTTERA